MKKTLSLALVLTLLLGLASCSKGGDARDLLSTVPGSAQFVTVINIDKLIHDIDATTDGNSLQLNEQLKSLTRDAGTSNPLDLLKNGGLRLTYAVMFVEQNNPYCTGFVGDEEAFKAYFEKEYDEKFTSDGNMEVCRNVAICQDRFWIAERASALENIAHYMTLNEKSSMASREIAEKLINGGEDITGLVSTAALASLDNNPYLSLSQQMMGDVDFIYFEVEFDKGKLEIEALMLDGKYKPVKDGGQGFEKINMGTVKMLEGNMDYLMAAGLQKGFMQTVLKQMPMQIPGLAGVEGTVAIAGSQQMQGSGMPTAMAVIKTGDANAATELGEYVKSTFSTAVKVSVKGQTLLLRTANLSGDINVGPHLDDLSGAYFGVVMSPNALKNMMPGNDIPFDGASFVIKPDDGSFKLLLKAYTGSNANALMTMLKIAEQANRK